MAFNHSHGGRLDCLWSIHDKVDFANVEYQFQKTSAVPGAIDRKNIKSKVVFLRIKKSKQLRVAQKNIDVMTLAMIYL